MSNNLDDRRQLAYGANLDVSNEELARRIAFILGQAAREKAEETLSAASVAGNGHQYGRQLADGEIACAAG